MNRRRSALCCLTFGAAAFVAVLAVDVPARADPAPLTQYPGETDADFAARNRIEQLRQQAAADETADAVGASAFGSQPAGSDLGAVTGLSGSPATGLAGALGGGTKSGLAMALIGLLSLVFGAVRVSRGLFRASRSLTKAGGFARQDTSFEARVAERLRELERSAPSPKLGFATPPLDLDSEPSPNPADSPASPPTPPPGQPTGPRTFGRRSG